MTSANLPKTIILRGSPEIRQAPAGAAITPGELLTMNSSGQVIAHNAAAGIASKWFAIENDIIGGSIDDDIASGDICQYAACKSGDQVYAWLIDEGNVAIGAFLEPDAAGALKATTLATTSATTAAAQPIARALQAVNNTGGTGPVRIKVEVL